MKHRPFSWGLSPAGVTTAVLLICAIGVGLLYVRGLEGANTLTMALVVGVPASASVVMMLLSAILPNLFGDDPPRFPRTLTLPVVFGALLLACATLWTTPSNSLVRPHDELSVVLVWVSPTVLILLALLQFGVLTVVSELWWRVSGQAHR